MCSSQRATGWVAVSLIGTHELIAVMNEEVSQAANYYSNGRQMSLPEIGTMVAEMTDNI